MPPRGTLYGYAIESTRPVARLRAGPAPRGRITLTSTTEPVLDEPAELVQLVEDGPGGDVIFATARAGSALLAWCALTGGHRIEVPDAVIRSDASADPAVWQDRAVSSLVPLLLVARGELLLHAAAVRTDAGALIVCGPSGRGKSTLAATLDTLGLPLLAEDAVALTLTSDGALAWPGPLDARVDAAVSMRLTPGAPSRASVRGKRLLTGGRGHGAEPVPVVALVSLEPRAPAPLDVQPLSPAEAMAWVFPNVLRLGRHDRAAAHARAAQLLRRVPCHRARLQDDIANAPGDAAELVRRVAGPPRAQLTAA